MDKKSITATLQALACDDKLRSKAARFRDVYNDVERTLAAGVSRTLVVETLAGLGLDYTLKGFDSAVRRNRLRNAARKATTLLHASPTDNAERPATRQGHDPSPSHNPADLDQIISSKPDLSALAKLAKRKTT